MDFHRLATMHCTFLNSLRRLLFGFVSAAVAMLAGVNPQDVIRWTGRNALGKFAAMV